MECLNCVIEASQIKLASWKTPKEIRMKFKTSAIAIMAALPLFATAAPTGEQLQDRAFGSVFGEYYQADKDKLNSASWMGQDEGSGYGFNVGYRVNESWAIRAEVARQFIDSDLVAYDIEGNRVGVDLNYYLSSLPMYIVGGVKNFTTGQDASAANIGLGLEIFTNDNLAFFAEANRYQGISKSFADVGVKLGCCSRTCTSTCSSSSASSWRRG